MHKFQPRSQKYAALRVGQVTVWRRAVGLGPLSERFT